MHVDGKCKECKAHTDMFCDHCGMYICKEHMHARKIPNTYKKFFFCKDCYKKNKKPVNPKIYRHPADFDFLP